MNDISQSLLFPNNIHLPIYNDQHYHYHYIALLFNRHLIITSVYPPITHHPSPILTKRMLESKPMQLHPLLTYDATTQALLVHDLPPQCRLPAYMVGVIEVKVKDYAVLALRPAEEQSHGVYISEVHTYTHTHTVTNTDTNTSTNVHGQKRVMYLVLASNESKVGEKYQDLFASIILTLANVCLFDIGSKYLRQARQADEGQLRSNYVVMNTHSNISEIYRAVLIVGASGHNKLEISGKIGSETAAIWQQLYTNCKQVQHPEMVHSALQHVISTRVLLTNYLNLQQLQHRFSCYIKLRQYMHQYSKQYVQVHDKQAMITLQQMSVLEGDLSRYDLEPMKLGSSANATEINRILQQEKRVILEQIHSMNNSLRQKMLHQLKEQFFKNVGNLGELYIKQSLAYKILEDYGISKDYCAMLYCDTLRTLQFQQSQKAKTMLYEKQSLIQSLSKQLAECQAQLAQNLQKISRYEEKCMDFRELYGKYTQKCTQLERERVNSLKDRAEIANLLTEQQRRGIMEQEQLNVISNLSLDKQKQQSVIAGLQNQLADKQVCVLQLSSKNAQFQQKISNYQNLEGQAWRCMQDLQSAKQQLNNYKGLVDQLEQHFDSFKKAEITKFNFVLKKNHEEHIKVKRELQQKCAIIEDNKAALSRLQGELHQERSRLKYCQMQAWVSTRDRDQEQPNNMMGGQQRINLKDHSLGDSNDRDNDNHRRNRSVIV